jgi:hypothetical protein
MPRTPLAWWRHAYRECEARLRRALGLPNIPALVSAIRCPHCRDWVKPRRFDLQHMACNRCLATLARPRRYQRVWSDRGGSPIRPGGGR